MSAVVSGLIGGIVAFAMAHLADRKQRSACVALDGWKRVRAGWFTNATIIGSAALAAFFAYFLLNGGSARPDAEVQNRYALLLFAISSAAALYTAWTTYGRTIMWKGNEIRVRTVGAREIVRRISDVSAVTKSEMLGVYRMTFGDGSTFRLSAYLRGAKELVAALPRDAPQD